MRPARQYRPHAIHVVTHISAARAAATSFSAKGAADEQDVPTHSRCSHQPPAAHPIGRRRRLAGRLAGWTRRFPGARCSRSPGRCHRHLLDTRRLADLLRGPHRDCRRLQGSQSQRHRQFPVRHGPGCLHGTAARRHCRRQSTGRHRLLGYPGLACVCGRTTAARRADGERRVRRGRELAGRSAGELSVRRPDLGAAGGGRHLCHLVQPGAVRGEGDPERPRQHAQDVGRAAGALEGIHAMGWGPARDRRVRFPRPR